MMAGRLFNETDPSAPRIAFVAGTLDCGGSERQLLYMATALRAAGATVKTYCVTGGEYEAALQQAGVSVTRFGASANPALRLIALSRLLRPFAPHIIHSMHAYCNLYAAGAAMVLGSISIGSLRSTLQFCRAANGRWTRWLVSAPHALLSNSQPVIDEVLREYRVRRPQYVPNAIDVSAFPATPRIRQGRVTALFLGRLIESKRVDLFLRALARAREICPELRGAVAGDGPQRQEWENLAAKLGLQSSVTFEGYTADAAGRLRDADMLILPSDSEGSSNAVMEAMAAAVPVIATPAGDTARLIEHGVSGFLIPFGDETEMASRMVQLAGSPELRRQLGAAGRRAVELKYDVSGLAGRLLAVYREVAADAANTRVVEALAR
jgi:glycosyltransferase involved in cell wall biosynthesis